MCAYTFARVAQTQTRHNKDRDRDKEGASIFAYCCWLGAPQVSYAEKRNSRIFVKTTLIDRAIYLAP